MAKAMVVVPEQKKVISRIKKRYDYLLNNEKTSGRIFSININNRVLSTAAKDVGFSPTVNIAVPVVEEGINDLAMNSLPTLLKCSSKVVENKNKEIADSMDVHLRMDQVEILVEQMQNASQSVTIAK